ncbi:hypothetical protein E1B28_001949 [Marasmius oreades]|uniref:Protein kinase domain-containing protein n=1 Tax=Marasmius oreades TaxID=181124 RepID=A0A9P8AG00_9AGAR|nr:uncharacterized protein E1B28_001949 [Marasmius oreades]KAG7100169.1 hypothetical protein E1B28_001949 [Marasmius oreades]
MSNQEIYKGIRGGKDVCLKVLRLFPSDDSARKEKTISELCKEALLWSQFDHPNVLPFLGVNNELFPIHGFCMVSPWMENGGIITFLQKNTGHDRLVVCREIAAGLTYLHSCKVAHGNMKPPNILVDKAGHCRLADFGLATTVHEASSSFNPTTATGSQKGTLRYMAPEIILMSDDSDSASNGRTSKIDKFAADVYAYACTLLEIITGKPPFPALNDAAVMLCVVTLNIRPNRPTEAGVWCPDNVWGLIEKCWDRKPKQRPMAKNILSFLERIEELRRSGEPWDQY